MSTSLSPRLRQARARVAANRRHHPDRPELCEDDLRALKVDATARFLRDALATPPLLTVDERSQLAAMLAMSDTSSEVAA